MAGFPKMEDSSDAVAAIIGAGIVPAGLELMDGVVIEAVEADSHLGLPTDVEAILLVEVDGDPESMDTCRSKIEEIVNDKGASQVISADSPEEADRLWTGRRAAFSVMARLRPNVVIEDVTVPVSNLTAMVRKVSRLATIKFRVIDFILATGVNALGNPRL